MVHTLPPYGRSVRRTGREEPWKCLPSGMPYKALWLLAGIGRCTNLLLLCLPGGG